MFRSPNDTCDSLWNRTMDERQRRSREIHDKIGRILYAIHAAMPTNSTFSAEHPLS
jgi:hypothetical protein